MPPRPAPPRRAFPIVGVGASAGGLEAFTQLLAQLPADCRDGVRPDPAPGPHAPELPRRGAGQGDRDAGQSRPRTARAWSPTTSTSSRRTRTSSIRDGCLTLVPRTGDARKLHLPIDSFFRALAGERGQPRDRRGALGDGIGRDRGLEGHQGRGRHHLRPGPQDGKVRRHASQRGRRRRRRLLPADSRARPGAGSPEPPPVRWPRARCSPQANDDTALARIFGIVQDRRGRRLQRVQGDPPSSGGSPAGWRCAGWTTGHAT